MSDANREMDKFWQIARPGKFPTMTRKWASIHYLKSAVAVKTDAEAKMKEMPTHHRPFGDWFVGADGAKYIPSISSK